MTLERWEQVKELLHAALKRSPAERAAFLTEACGEDVALRREMESLLAWAEKGEGLEQSSPEKPLHSMAHRGTATVNESPEEARNKAVFKLKRDVLLANTVPLMLLLAITLFVLDRPIPRWGPTGKASR